MSDAKLRQRLFAKIRFTDACWYWEGTRSTKGYGRIFVMRKPIQAHRAIYELLVGPIPEGLTLDHLCRNRLCVKPEHLEPVTNRENIRRGIGPSAQAARATHCRKGHAYSEENTRRHRDGSRVCKQCDRDYQARKASTPEGKAAKSARFKSWWHERRSPQ